MSQHNHLNAGKIDSGIHLQPHQPDIEYICSKGLTLEHISSIFLFVDPKLLPLCLNAVVKQWHKLEKISNVMSFTVIASLLQSSTDDFECKVNILLSYARCLHINSIKIDDDFFVTHYQSFLEFISTRPISASLQHTTIIERSQNFADALRELFSTTGYTPPKIEEIKLKIDVKAKTAKLYLLSEELSTTIEILDGLDRSPTLKILTANDINAWEKDTNSILCAKLGLPTDLFDDESLNGENYA